jgi:transposase
MAASCQPHVQEVSMDVLYPNCAGIDVHKKTVVVCCRTTAPDDTVIKETRTFSTMTTDLLALSDSLTSLGITHVAMESTGEFWKPLYNLLEGSFTILVVNAHHMHNVPGRKTDVKLRHEVVSVAVETA